MIVDAQIVHVSLISNHCLVHLASFSSYLFTERGNFVSQLLYKTSNQASVFGYRWLSLTGLFLFLFPSICHYLVLIRPVNFSWLQYHVESRVPGCLSYFQLSKAHFTSSRDLPLFGGRIKMFRLILENTHNSFFPDDRAGSSSHSLL